MKPTRILASATLIFSSLALITAAGISVGDEPGVVRMGSNPTQAGSATTPTPDPVSTGVATVDGGPPAPDAGMYPQPAPYAPYFERSTGATQQLPHSAYQPTQPFGPIMMFETNINEGLGYGQSYQRLNARIPYHIVPNTNVLIGDISASVTNYGDPVANLGMIYRNYDASYNRIFGANAYVDYDQGNGTGDWYQVGAGLESLGKYLDFRLNGYQVVGDDSTLLSSTTSSALRLMGNSAFKVRNEVLDNAYSGLQAEVGGPLPVLGQYGLNMYVGGYYLANGNGYDTGGFQARWEALVTESLRVNTYLTTDDTFGTNSWVSLQYDLPNYKNRRVLRPSTVRERLQDPVVRDNRIHVNRDARTLNDAVINSATGLAYNILNVNPNATAMGNGTFETPYSTLQAAAIANNAGVDIIRVVPRADDTTTNLTVNGGISLFDDQTLLSSLKPLILAPDCIIPADTGLATILGPLISNPTMIAGGSVVRLANNDAVIGMRIDAANAAGTVFGNGIVNPLPITDVNLTCNIFTNYTNGAFLQDVSGRIIVDQNEFNGLIGASNDGLALSVAGGNTAELLVSANSASNNSGVGLKIIAEPGARINADDPDGLVPTGIVDNETSDNGTGILIEGRAGSTVNAVVEDNTAERNTFDGISLTTDGGTFNLASLANNSTNENLGNGIFIHYLNGGIFRSVSEDLDGDGTLDAGEDLNGNGRLDQGIVSNTSNDNGIAGICIFGEDASEGVFDIGGPNASLGNTLNGNEAGGILVDLQDTATAQVDALFNNIQGGNPVAGLTIVLDFIDPGQASQVDANGRLVDPFDVTAYGFAASDFDTVTNAILQTVESYYKNLPTSADSPLSSIIPGESLNIDFVIGDTGTAPSNGATEYYVVTIGDSAVPLGGLAGQAADIGNIRNAMGVGPGQGIFGTPQANGASAMGVYTDSINQFSPLLNPPNAFTGARDQDGIYVQSPESTPNNAITGLTSGNLTFTRRAIGLVTAHELGHTLSLRHILQTGAVTPNGLQAIMGTPALDTPIQVLAEPTEFAYSGTNPGELPGEAAFLQRSINQLATAVGTRSGVGATEAGIKVTAADNAVLKSSTFNNNIITGASQDGLAIVMNDNAVAEGVTVQSNAITNGLGHGVRLEANGPGAEIHATSTIGGTGINVYSGTSYNQGNTISNNAGDGFRALAANGGMIDGNLLNNTITDNGGNGAAFLIENGGFIDFGTLPNRRIANNTITGNGGAGILFSQQVAADNEAQLDATVLGNTISDNSGGGIVSNLFGPNNEPPFPPAILNNNRLNLTIGGTAVGNANIINGNSDVGIGVDVSGNGKAVVDITNTSITGTIDGPDPRWNGDGLGLRRSDSSLLLATVTNSIFTGNAGDGMDVLAQGSDRFDPNQPMSGTANMVTVLNSVFNNNTENGARYSIHGDATLISDVTGSSFNNNGQNGVLVTTSEFSSFGDPTDDLPPGRRSIFDGNTFNENGVDGVQLVATEESRVLVEITSNRVPAGSPAHAGANTNGDTSISRNGRNGVRIDTTGGRSDILITSGTGQTTIDGNGTVAGGNGILWNASGTSDGVVRASRTIITNSIAGATEVGDPNANDDVDVADGDGIQANFSNSSTATLIVGGVGEGNMIQSNEDDGIALTATGSDATGNPRPVISITGNTIGGTRDGIAAGNGGDGVSLNMFGGTATGIPPAAIDTDASDGTLSFNDGVTESGAIPQLTITDNLISQNGQRGVNLLLTGAGGIRNRENGASVFDPIRITLDNNTVVSNGTEGIFYRADANMNQSRFRYLANFPFPNPPFNPADDRPQFPFFYDPLLPEFTNLNLGSVNGNTAYLSPYLNLRTVQNSFLTVTNNTIQNNGTNLVTGEGLFINVGTGAYVAADVQNNAFGGNLEEDFRTASFLSAGETFTSVDDAGNLTFDAIYLDDTAQFDLRFQTNAGNQILPSSRGDDVTPLGATYTTLDPLKAIFLGNLGASNREADLFQVDNGPMLNDPNNSFITFGVTQNIQSAFSNGGYNLRAAADPLFPNIGFPPFLP